MIRRDKISSRRVRISFPEVGICKTDNKTQKCDHKSRIAHAVPDRVSWLAAKSHSQPQTLADHELIRLSGDLRMAVKSQYGSQIDAIMGSSFGRVCSGQHERLRSRSDRRPS